MNTLLPAAPVQDEMDRIVDGKSDQHSAEADGQQMHPAKEQMEAQNTRSCANQCWQHTAHHPNRTTHHPSDPHKDQQPAKTGDHLGTQGNPVVDLCADRAGPNDQRLKAIGVRKIADLVIKAGLGTCVEGQVCKLEEDNGCIGV